MQNFHYQPWNGQYPFLVNGTESQAFIQQFWSIVNDGNISRMVEGSWDITEGWFDPYVRKGTVQVHVTEREKNKKPTKVKATEFIGATF